MPNTLPQRLGVNTRVIAGLETSPGVDPGSPAGYVLPLRSQGGVQIKKPTAAAPVYMQGLQGYGRVSGAIDSQATLPLGFEFLTTPLWFKMLVGATGYTKTTLANGYVLHEFALPSGVVTFPTAYVQNEYGEASTQYLRAKYMQLKSIKASYAPTGPTPLDIALLGSGDSAITDIGGTKTNNGYSAPNMFNGAASIAGLSITGMPAFDLMMDTKAGLSPAAFNGGVAAAVTRGVPEINGNVTVIMSTDGSGVENNLAFYNYAVNEQLIPLDCMWANLPLGLMTQYCRMVMPTVRFDAASPLVGGDQGLTIAQPWNMVNDVTSKIAAEAHGTVTGPYTIVTGTSDVFAVKIDGGSTITVTFAAGSKTAAQLVALLNADSGFAAVAIADVFGPWVRVKSLTTGTSSSVQFDTTTAHHCGTLLGFNNTSFAGFNTTFVARFLNKNSASY